MLSGYPGTRVLGGPGSGLLTSRVTRWRVRVRPPEFGGYPLVASTRRMVPLMYVDVAGLGEVMWPGWGVRHKKRTKAKGGGVRVEGA